MKTPQNPVAKVVRTIRASPEKVFDAWIDPKLIGQFLFGPRLREEEIIRIETHPEVKGHFSFVVKRSGQELNHLGHYLEVDRPRRLAFTWRVEQPGSAAPAPDSEVMLDFKPAAGGATELTLAHELHPDWAAFVPRAQEAWAKMIGVLAQILETA